MENEPIFALNTNTAFCYSRPFSNKFVPLLVQNGIRINSGLLQKVTSPIPNSFFGKIGLQYLKYLFVQLDLPFSTFTRPIFQNFEDIIANRMRDIACRQVITIQTKGIFNFFTQ